MATYLILNLIVLALVYATAHKLGVSYNRKNVLFSMAVLLPLTLIFDNLIIGDKIVAYDQTLISGILLGLAPIEDFIYSLVAIMLVPLLWKLCSHD